MNSEKEIKPETHSQQDPSSDVIRSRVLLGITIFMFISLITMSISVSTLTQSNSQLNSEIANLEDTISKNQLYLEMAQQKYDFTLAELDDFDPFQQPDRAQVFVFYSDPVPQSEVLAHKARWERISGVKKIVYITSSEAKQSYLANLDPNDILYESLVQADIVLPSSLDIYLDVDADRQQILSAINPDIQNLLAKLNIESGNVIQVRTKN